MSAKLTTEEFVHRSNKIHNSKYSYADVCYTHSQEKVCILCPVHGKFLQQPQVHLRGVGCVKCGTHQKSTDKSVVLDRFMAVHSMQYSYDLIEYKNMKTKISIECPTHGIFRQTPQSHVNGNGCPRCADMNKLGGYTQRYFNTYPHNQLTPSIIYVVQVKDRSSNYQCIKVGITVRDVSMRFKTEPNIQVSVVAAYQAPLYEAWKIEQYIKRTFRLSRVDPPVVFGGRTECFDEAVVSDIIQHLNVSAFPLLEATT